MRFIVFVAALLFGLTACSSSEVPPPASAVSTTPASALPTAPNQAPAKVMVQVTDAETTDNGLGVLVSYNITPYKGQQLDNVNATVELYNTPAEEGRQTIGKQPLNNITIPANGDFKQDLFVKLDQPVPAGQKVSGVAAVFVFDKTRPDGTYGEQISPNRLIYAPIN